MNDGVAGSGDVLSLGFIRVLVITEVAVKHTQFHVIITMPIKQFTMTLQSSHPSSTLLLLLTSPWQPDTPSSRWICSLAEDGSHQGQRQMGAELVATPLCPPEPVGQLAWPEWHLKSQIHYSIKNTIYSHFSEKKSLKWDDLWRKRGWRNITLKGCVEKSEYVWFGCTDKIVLGISQFLLSYSQSLINTFGTNSFFSISLTFLNVYGIKELSESKQVN